MNLKSVFGRRFHQKLSLNLQYLLETKNTENACQPAFACSRLTIETLEQGVKYVQSNILLKH